MVEHSDGTPDFADIAVAHWQRERPDLDLRAMGTLARFARLHLVGGRAVDAVFAAHGLDRGEFDVLAGLRRTGAPYELSPSHLADILLITRAGMTKRIDRLERRGLVTRRSAPDDRRSLLVGLTPDGLAVVDAAVTDHARNETRLLDLLTEGEAQAFDTILRKLLAGLDARSTSPGREPVTRPAERGAPGSAPAAAGRA
ncbi:MarR family transcriptional regulator [Isoptericola halotolerans]|uniref:DNA-binding MarR family transcriptional regulator n=1 Tax=Isoptericola halotolerans TaxID=300560 RepID=A0ABX2A1L8_9MICO|nr:MarR family transcriptional regulator [Isoptericola halotolerans]NOV95488.1 DNA-binding MarR family transcriptional regulator [Isoptericola halotolerans]